MASDSTQELLVKMCAVITGLSEKIDNLEQKLDAFIKTGSGGKRGGGSGGGGGGSCPDSTPPMDFYGWVDSMPVVQEHVNVVFRSSILEGFKQFVHALFTRTETANPRPIVLFGSKPKILYVFSKISPETDETVDPGRGEWMVLDETVVCGLIEQVWRKMLEFYYTCPEEPGVSETVRDMNKKKLIDMRKGLVEKHLKEIERFLIREAASGSST